jgi:predicted transcriptional regulator
MDHKTAVLVIVNAMQSDKSPEDIQREIEVLLQTVAPEERETVLKQATETYKRVEARLPVEPDAPDRD